MMVINLWVMLESGDFLTSEVTGSSRLCSVQLVVGSAGKINGDASCHLIQHLQVEILNHLAIQ
jgi:hypothetical protein